MRAVVTEATERDRDIVELLRKAGRDRAFEELLRRYEGKVYRLCCALLRERTQAEDAAQESLVRVWKALDRYDGRAALSSWIYAITRNRCLTALDRRRSLDSLDELGEEAEFGLPATGQPGDGRAEELLELVQLLPERLRRVLLLYYYEERSVSEVALMLGCPEGTVKTTLFRARAALAEMLQRRGLDDPAYWQEEAS
jgi:RNA polymerase sigma-70 factor (ECF subfamily)